MPKSPDVVTAELRATLWQRVGMATRAQVDELTIVVDALAADDADEVVLDRGQRLAHSIAGTSGVYGFEHEARAAALLEALLRRWRGPSNVTDARTLLRVLQCGLEVRA
jgi:HPt (histidine-containing phosphotransfer) domain-containing protein